VIINIKLIITAIYFVLISFCISNASQLEYKTVVTGRVSVITKQTLYFLNLRYFINPEVVIVVERENGKQIPLSTLVTVGQIDKARLYLNANQVVKIVVLEMGQ
jgi:hypothetical protein